MRSLSGQQGIPEMVERMTYEDREHPPVRDTYAQVEKTDEKRAGGNGFDLHGSKVYVPRMTHSGAVAFAAAFRSVGIDADVPPDSNERTLEL